MKKRCSKCGIEKDESEFSKNGSSADGFGYRCKECNQETTKAWYRKCGRAYHAEWKSKNREKIREQQRERRRIEKENRVVVPRETVSDPRRLERIKERRKADLGFRLQEIVRSKVHRMLKGIDTSYKSLIGCSEEILRKWLEFQFDGQMTWDNLGTYWHVDHILPINKFDFDSPRAKFICFNWKNLQPLPAFENMSKSDAIQLHYYFNSIVTIHRFIQREKLDSSEYQGVRESLRWLREKLGYGNNLVDEGGFLNKNPLEMDNPQPSPYRTAKSHGEGSTTIW